ncbi:MAG: hypothetical protein M0Z61_12735 [Nitrospiraceae bacterium]|nr:hypothetical protein [Nitrospiraceae bacterium]
MPDTLSADERLKRKVSLAQERDTRVVITRTVDTHRVLDIVRNADRGIRILRANLLIRFKPEDAVPLLVEYQKAIEGLHHAAAKICAMAGVPYRAPRGLEGSASAGSQEKGDKAGDSAEASHLGKEEKKRKAL